MRACVRACISCTKCTPRGISNIHYYICSMTDRTFMHTCVGHFRTAPTESTNRPPIHPITSANPITHIFTCPVGSPSAFPTWFV